MKHRGTDLCPTASPRAFSHLTTRLRPSIFLDWTEEYACGDKNSVSCEWRVLSVSVCDVAV